jgi:hypothetical protein
VAISSLSLVRAFLLINVVIVTLCATIWSAHVQNLASRVRGYSAKTHDQTPSVLLNERSQRLWLALWAAVFMFAWFYLGTRDGVAMWTEFVAGLGHARTGSSEAPDVRAFSYRARVFAAWTAVAISMAAFFAHAIYGVYLDFKLNSFARERPPRRQRWNYEYYVPGAEEWLGRDRRWKRWSTAVWVGSIVVGNLLYVVIHP